MQHPHLRRQSSIATFTLCLFASCTGTVSGGGPAARGDQSDPGAGSAGTRAGGSGGEAQPAAITDPVLPFLRLTREQLRNAVRDLLGVPAGGTSVAPSGRGDSGFAQAGSMSPAEARALLDDAEAASTAIASRAAKLIPCDAAKGERTCARELVTKLGRRAYRRPLTDDEQTDLLALYDTGRAADGLALDHGGALALVVEAMLQSPGFLYRWELGPRSASATNGRIALTDHELASRLSFLLWNTIPDPTLDAEADAGRLHTADALEAQARRMLRDPKLGDAIGPFATYWLDLVELPTTSKSDAKFPQFTPSLRQAMLDETLTFVRAVIGGDGNLATLLSAKWSFVNAPLAALYGVAATGDELRKTATDSVPRAGLLTHASLLAHGAGPAFASPTRRGRLIRERLLCQPIPPPPPNVDTTQPGTATATTLRAQYEAHVTTPSCRACHARMDPLGFAFDQYDAIGRFDATAGVGPTNGELDGAGSGDGAFANGVELARRLATSSGFASCTAKQLLRFGLGRSDVDADAPSLDAMTTALDRSSGDAREAIVALVRSPAFSFRSANPGEVLR